MERKVKPKKSFPPNKICVLKTKGAAVKKFRLSEGPDRSGSEDRGQVSEF